MILINFVILNMTLEILLVDVQNSIVSNFNNISKNDRTLTDPKKAFLLHLILSSPNRDESRLT